MERKTKDLVTQMMTEVKFVPKTTAVTEQKSQALHQNFLLFMDESEPVELAALVSVDLEMHQYLNDQDRSPTGWHVVHRRAQKRR